MDIRQAASVVSSPAFPLISEGMNYLVQEGLHCGSDHILHETDQAIWAEEDGEVLGVIVFRCKVAASSIQIVLSYVEPSSRRNGLYSSLMNALVKRAEEERIVSILSTVSTANAAMIKLMQKMGRAPTAVLYELKV
jgi:GNAT superfamily N-acetyltransferase